MCKSVKSKRLFMAAALASFIFALILAGCGGNKGNPASNSEYTINVDIDQEDVTAGTYSRVERDPDQKTYKLGDSVSLRAIPGSKHKFVYWSGALLDPVNPVKFEVKGNWTVTAHFKRFYTLEVNMNPVAGGGSVSPDTKNNDYLSGDTVTLTATAAAGYKFLGWSGLGTSMDTAAAVKVTMNNDKTLTANFLQIAVQDSCTANPYIHGCPGYCVANPTAQECIAVPPGPCDANPSAPGCQGYCDANPSTPGCPGYCTANPSAQGCPGYCVANPTAPGCQEISYTLEVNKNLAAGGTVSIDPAKASYVAGEQVTVTAAANTGYVFTGWSGASTSTTSPVTITMDGNKTLTANFQLVPEGYYTLTVNKNPNAGGDVSWIPDTVLYKDGKTVKLTATAAEGYEFIGWLGAAESEKDTVTITMDSDKIITANFKLKEYTFTVEADPAAGGTVSTPVPAPNAEGKYKHGDTVSVTAAASTGYVFTGWSGASEAATSTVTIKMDGNKTLTANFELIPDGHHALTVDVSPNGGGDVSRDPAKTTYPDGETVTLTATPSNGYEFAGWSGASTAATPAVTITMDDNKAITANFRLKTYTLTVTKSPENAGTVLRSPIEETYTHGQIVTITVTAATGYAFQYWSGDETSNDNPLDITMTGNKILQANFSAVDVCASNPSAPGCGITEMTYCYWAETDGCYPLVEPDAVDPNSNTGLTYLVNCQRYGFVSQYFDCRDYDPPTNLQYCRWSGVCYPLTAPDAIDPESNGGLTYLQNCRANGDGGVHNSLETCEAWVPGTEYYCYWGGTTGCVKITNPNDLMTGKTITNLENCQQNSQPEQAFTSMAVCEAWTPPAVQEYCNYGPCVGPSDDGYSCTTGGCYVKKASDLCTGGAVVTSCPTGTKPPNAQY